MGKIKIYEIAKKTGLTSKEVLEIAKKLDIQASSHLSGVDDNDAKKIEEKITENKSEAIIKNESEQEFDKANKKERKKSNKDNNQNSSIKQTKKEEKAPVIIRREVIITDESTKKKEEKKDFSKKNNNVGFVERRTNQDYNIVYRNKPNKPKTVSELFGIKKQEETKIEEIETKQNIESNLEIKKESKEEIAENTAKPNNQKSNYYNNRTSNDERPNNKYNNNNRYNKNYSSYNNANNRYNNNRSNTFNNRNEKNSTDNNNFRNNKNNYNSNYNTKFQNNNNNKFANKKTLDEKGIEKNIKNIMATDIPEKETIKEYNRNIDRQKNNNKFDENRTKKNKQRNNKMDNSFDEGKLKSLKQSNRLSSMFEEQDGGMLDYYDLTTQRGRKGKRKVSKNGEERTKQKIFKLTEIEIPETITVKDLAAEMKKTTAELIKVLLGFGIMATINNEVDFDTAFLVAEEFGITAKKKEIVTEEDILFDDSEDKAEELKPRPPVVVVMGHVDHGKTSLLDAIRKTNIIEGEAGGITQAIGAYKVKVNDREITFLDTPGHEAFTAMRSRGAQITDIAILVVAANDGIMPQTIEAINHAKSANIPIIVAINKIDLPDANIDKIKQELMTYELVAEEWGGDTIIVPISAKQNTNIDQLLEMVLLEADVLELKANPKKQAKGVVIEARLDKSKGAIATMLVQRGSLDVGDTIVVGSSIGRIRAMKDDKGKRVKSAGPSTPVEIMGLTDVPEAGDTFYEVKDEKTAKHLIERRKRQAREKSINATTKITLDNLFTQMEEGKLKTLNLIVKADVQGSVEAVKQSMEKLTNEEVRVKVIHAATGGVNESDVTLAKVSNAIIIAFNVRPNPTAKERAEKEEVEIKQYSVIYKAIEEVESAMKGLLDPKFQEKVIGNAEVRQTFKISNVGTIAGAYVLSGKMERNAGVRIIREDVVIHEGKLATLKRFKDDAKEVTKGFECGIQIEDFNDVKEGDIIEAFVMEQIDRG